MANKEIGASLAEFLVAAPLVLVIGMATLQAGLIYHGKTTLNYAVFEAARTGAVRNAQVAAMRKELGQRLAPVQGGDGSHQSLTKALTQMNIEVGDVSNTQVRILNPTKQAFNDWGVISRVSNRRVIPNVHLRHRVEEVGPTSGVTIQDANLLKIQVTYGVDLKVPVVGELFAEAMQVIDTENAHYYRRNKFPLSAVATVRMQSEAWEDEVIASLVPLGVADTDETESDIDESREGGELPGSTPEQPAEVAEACDDGEYGLGSVTEVIDTSDYLNQQCTISTQAHTPSISPVVGSIVDESDCA